MAGRSKGSKVVVTVRPGEAPEADSVQLKIRVSAEVARKLRLESFGRDCSLGRVVEVWAKLAPTRFYLADRSKGSDGPGRPPVNHDTSSPAAQGDAGPLGVVSEAG